jgi:prephenate dehydrogenase
MGLRAQGADVMLADIDESALHTALSKSGGRAWDGSTPADVAVIATPPSSAARTMRAVAMALPQAVITDVSSVKASVLDALGEVPQPERIVGGHPMAGREVSGARAAQSNLFVDRPWVITRLPRTTQPAVDSVHAMVTALGAVPIERGVVEHDQAVALVSHTPQIVASALAGTLVTADAEHVSLAGQGLRDTIRLAGSDPALWTDILLANAQPIADDLDKVAAILGDTARALRIGDASSITAMLSAGNAGRNRLPGKHGTVQANTVTLVVRVADKPGELARLFGSALSVAVNLEDVRIDHSLGRMTGLVELTVASESSEVLASALESAGFSVVR